jgi:hypothetical protein
VKKKIDFKSTKMELNPFIPPVNKRPKCIKAGCRERCAITGTAKDGSPYYRDICHVHHLKNILKRKGLTATEYKNSTHPYLRYRKSYCENIDKRLGFKCTTNVFWQGMLDVDHKNGNPLDNRPRNLQTLCKCCHAYKTNKNKDYKTLGRKSLKLSK